jgi:hypothetical protein
MNLTHITSQDLKRIAQLLESKEALQAQLAGIDRQLAAFEGGVPAAPAAVVKAKPGRKPGPAKVEGPAPTRVISAAGRARIAAAQRARWAKQKAAAGKPAPAPAPAAKPAASKPAPKAAGRPKKAGRAKPGQFKDSVLALVKAAGKSGVTVKDAAAKLGVKAQRVYVWFGATGKTIKEIKKVAPATYAWVG